VILLFFHFTSMANLPLEVYLTTAIEGLKLLASEVNYLFLDRLHFQKHNFKFFSPDEHD